MPRYTVHFSAPVVYLPNHPKRQVVTDLLVVADSSIAALQHAVRVTEGEGLAEEVRECPDA